MSEQRYPMAPLIRFTLVSLYFALVFPLPWLAPSNLQPWLIGALPVGFLLVWALVSEEVSLNEAGLQVGYPRWCSWLLRRGWSLRACFSHEIVCIYLGHRCPDALQYARFIKPQNIKLK